MPRLSAFSFAGSAHVGEPLHRFGEIAHRLVQIAVLDAVPHTVADMPFQHHLPALVQGRFGRVQLGEDVLTGHILVDHPVNGLYLPRDLFQPPVQIFRIHTLPHPKFISFNL